MFTLFRSAVLLLLCWLPVVQAADISLQNPQNTHAEVRLRADSSGKEGTRLLLDVQLQHCLLYTTPSPRDS